MAAEDRFIARYLATTARRTRNEPLLDSASKWVRETDALDDTAVRPRATDQEIQKWVARQHGFVPESAWIMCCKEEVGLAAPGNAAQENPCPPDKVAAIKQAFRHFGLL